MGTEYYRYQVQAYDPEGGPLSYYISSAPRFDYIQVDQNGLVTTYNPVRYNQTDSQIIIRVVDSFGNETHQIFHLTVEPPVNNHPPTFTSFPSKQIWEIGTTFSYTINTSDLDRFGSQPDYCTFTLNQEAIDAGFELRNYNNNTYGHLQWRPTVEGSHEVTITAIDSHGNTAT